MQPIIAIALSGGIDSLVAAAILKAKGNRVIGLHFLTGYEPAIQDHGSSSTAYADFNHMAETARRQLTPMVDQLQIPLHIIDLRSEFKSRVVDYFVHTYQAGRTPNPCLQCNPSIKFGLLFDKAKRLGGLVEETTRALERGEQREVSTGYFAGTERSGGTHGGRAYAAIHRRYAMAGSAPARAA